MQVHELEWFLATVEDPNLTRVAAAHTVSQPALSRALRRLEATVGAPLFDRVGRALAPNPQGRLLAGHVRRALGELQAGTEAVRSVTDPEHGEIRLGFLHTLGTWLVPDLVSAFRADHPAVRLQLRQDTAEDLAVAVLEGEQDLVITSPEPGHPRLVWQPLFSEPLRLIVPAEHRLAGRRRVQLREVAGDAFVAFRRGLGMRAVVDAMCARAGFVPDVAFEGDEVQTVRGLVGAGLGVAVVPDRIGATPGPEGAAGALQRPGPRALALVDPASRRVIGLCHHAERHRPPAVEAFAQFVATRAAAIAGA